MPHDLGRHRSGGSSSLAAMTVVLVDQIRNA